MSAQTSPAGAGGGSIKAGQPDKTEMNEVKEAIPSISGGDTMEEESGGGASAATPGAPPPGSFRALLSGRKSDMKVLPQKNRTSTGAGEGFISLDLGDDESGAKPGVGEEGAGEGQACGKRRREDEAEIKPVRNSFGEDFLSLDDLAEPGSSKKKSTREEVSSTSGGCERENEENYNKKSPWARGRAYQNSCKDRCVSLHHEICDFVEFIQPVRAETKKRDELVEHLRAITEQLWSDARLEVFGSCITGLQLPCSDVDMVVLDYDCDRAKALEMFACVIKADGGFTKIQVIAKAKVPIIKFEDLASGTPLNVCFGQEDGVKNSQMVKKCLEYYPAMRPLVLVLKQFLYNRDLHETYTGGVGSYLLAMTVLSMLQNHPGKGADHTEGEGNLGALLLEYLNLYGIRFNYDQVGIMVAEGGGVFPLEGEGGYMYKREMGWKNNDRPHLLSVQDPLVEDSDIGRNSFNIRGFKLAMEQAYWTLLDPNGVRPKGETALGSILRWDERWESAVGEHRIRSRGSILPKKVDKSKQEQEGGLERSTPTGKGWQGQPRRPDGNRFSVFAKKGGGVMGGASSGGKLSSGHGSGDLQQGSKKKGKWGKGKDANVGKHGQGSVLGLGGERGVKKSGKKSGKKEKKKLKGKSGGGAEDGVGLQGRLKKIKKKNLEANSGIVAQLKKSWESRAKPFPPKGQWKRHSKD